MVRDEFTGHRGVPVAAANQGNGIAVAGSGCLLVQGAYLLPVAMAKAVG